MRLVLFLSPVCLALVRAGVLPVATFDGAASTTLVWETVDDPVMGGQSKSNFEVDSVRRFGVWSGDVAIVPFLKAPGFCNLQSPGRGKTAKFPDLSKSRGIVVRAREAVAGGLTQFNVMLMSKGARHLLKIGVYVANFTSTSTVEDHLVPWSAFSCTWRGQTETWCPEITTQLDVVNSIGLGTYFPGTAGKFSLEIESISADMPSAQGAATYIDLATFDGKAPHRWHSEDEKGGQSTSAIDTTGSYADYKGTTRIVPALKAPGFTIAMTEGFPLLSKFPDASSMDGLTVGVRNLGGRFSGFKVAFCDSQSQPVSTFYRCQFQSFKADLLVPQFATDKFVDVFVPWSEFSDKWDSATGKHTAENPPVASNLKSITQLQIWTEGVEGDFHLQIQYVRASKGSVELV